MPNRGPLDLDALIARTALIGDCVAWLTSEPEQKELVTTSLVDFLLARGWRPGRRVHELESHLGSKVVEPAEERPPRCYVVWSYEHEAWWGPDRCGYTTDLAKAGRYGTDELGEITTTIPPEEEVAVHERLATGGWPPYIRRRALTEAGDGAAT